MSSKPKIKLSPYIKNEKGEFVEPPKESHSHIQPIRISISGDGERKERVTQPSDHQIIDVIKIALTEEERKIIEKLKNELKG